MVKLKLLAGCLSVSWAGQNFEADKAGVVEVPEEAVPDLLPHGATVYVEPPADPDDLLEGDGLALAIADAEKDAANEKLSKAKREAAAARVVKLKAKVPQT